MNEIAYGQIGDRYYEAVINIKNVKRGKLFKDVTKIKDVTQDIMSSYGENPKSQFLRTSSMDILSNETGNVKQQYSLSDSDGKELTKEQQEYFKDSKMRDENGNLKVMYHGSQNAGFHVFDSKFSDDDTSFFFVDRNEVAQTYSGTNEVYEARTIRSAEDMNNFLAEIGEEDYKVVEENGKFTLLQENEYVADSDTAQGIYEEYCDWVGVGYGDANYNMAGGFFLIQHPYETNIGLTQFLDKPHGTIPKFHKGKQYDL